MSVGAASLAEVNGQRYGKLTAVRYVVGNRTGVANRKYWKFRCECGGTAIRPLALVIRGEVRDCGCVDLAAARHILRPANLSEFIQRHGRYEIDPVSQTSPGVLAFDGKRISNRAVTVIDDWIDDGLFERRHIRVIEHARDLWRDIRRPTHDYFDGYDPEDRAESFEAERAKNLLRRAKRLVHHEDWSVFENVVRWNEPLGVSGSRLYNPNAAALSAAKEIVRDVAELIARSLVL